MDFSTRLSRENLLLEYGYDLSKQAAEDDGDLSSMFEESDLDPSSEEDLSSEVGDEESDLSLEDISDAPLKISDWASDME